MRILELHTIALALGLFIAACNSVIQPTLEFKGQKAKQMLEANGNTNSGLLAEYFDNINFTGTRMTRIEPNNPASVNKPCVTTVNWLVTLERLHKAARAGSSNLTLVLSGEEWGGIYALGPLPKVSDPNIIYSVHYYGPLEFSHQGATWLSECFSALENVPYPITTHTLAAIWPKIEGNIAGNPSITDKPKARSEAKSTLECYYGTAGSGCTPYGSQSINEAFNQVVTQAARLGVPTSRILLGEFGVQGR
jgi:Cellulase (glycosyl hydrolase family 5)